MKNILAAGLGMRQLSIIHAFRQQHGVHACPCPGQQVTTLVAQERWGEPMSLRGTKTRPQRRRNRPQTGSAHPRPSGRENRFGETI